MTPAAAILLGAAGLFAAVNWLSRLRHDRALELVTKPTTMILLVGAALALDTADPTRRGWFVAALVASLLGDIALMFKAFPVGVAAFALAHAAYITGMMPLVSTDPQAWLGSFGVVVLTCVMLWLILGAVRSVSRNLAALVAGYATIIAVMVSVAGATGRPVLAAAALLFFFSDGLIAFTTFRGRVAWAPVTIMVTYHLAQAGFVASLI